MRGLMGEIVIPCLFFLLGKWRNCKNKIIALIFVII